MKSIEDTLKTIQDTINTLPVKVSIAKRIGRDNESIPKGGTDCPPHDLPYSRCTKAIRSLQIIPFP